MNLLIEEAKKVTELIRRLDGDLVDHSEIPHALDRLRRWYDKRESALLLRREMILERLGNDSDAGTQREEVERIVAETLAEIESSGYLPAGADYPLARRRGRPRKTPGVPRNFNLRCKLTVRKFRFSTSRTLSCIRDDVHCPPDYKIDPYEGITAEKALMVIRTLLDAADSKKNEGWVKSEKDWRGAFQRGVYLRFLREQIRRGSMRDGHNGQWRLFTDAEFDQLSSCGRFRKRVGKV